MNKLYGPPDPHELLVAMALIAPKDGKAAPTKAELNALLLTLSSYPLSHNGRLMQASVLASLERLEEAREVAAISLALYPHSVTTLKKFIHLWFGLLSEDVLNVLEERSS